MSTQAARWYAIRRRLAPAASAPGAVSAAEIYIYGDIGESWYEETVTAAEFVRELAALDVAEITVRINSIGGSVPDGLAIYNAMRRHPATITVEVDGMAFSVASLIAMGGDKVHMASNALLMVHAPWTFAAGNSRDLRDLADQLDIWAQAMATSYAARTGDQAGALAMLTDGEDHYFTAEDALAAGYIDAITDPLPMAASAARNFDLSRFRSLPAALAKSIPVAERATSHLTGDPMDQKQTPATPAAGAVAPAQPTAAEILAADKTRREGIRAAFARFASASGVAELQRACEDDPSVTVEAAGKRLLDHLGSQTEPIAGVRITTVEDEGDKRREAIVAAMLVRAGFASKEQASSHTANPWRGMTLIEIARASLERIGVSTKGLDKRELVAAAFTHSTSDFPVLLTDAIHRTLLASYGLQPMTWSRFCKRGSVSDFRAHHRFRVGSLGNLQPKNELGEYKSVAIPDGERSSITASTKGYIINISREIIINDDLGAITDQAAAMGRSAARTVEADVYAALLSNSGAGPIMNDGLPLFHADHGNIISPAAGPTSASFNAFRVAMAQQRDVSGNDYLDLRPAVWLGPVGLEGEAKIVNQAQYEPGSGKNVYTPNISLGLFRDIVGSPRLSGTRHYAFADPQEAAALEVAFLDGIDTPYLEQESAFDTDGARFKVRLDYGVAGHDWRGAAMNPGA